MNAHLKKELLAEANRIGEGILSKAKQDSDGIYWETLGFVSNKEDEDRPQAKWQVSENIYSGVAGILLYFMELYKKTGDEKYHTIVKDSAPWLIKYCEKNSTAYYAFFTGRMGVSYTFLKIAEFLNDPSYINHALKVAEKCEKFLQTGPQQQTVDDLINGIAGTILGLIHLHEATREKWILSKIDTFVKVLIERANWGRKGIYWERSHQQSRGLCGFSHGAAGIGAVFLELGNYFKNPDFYYWAEQAFAYETFYFDNDKSNWPDFRKGLFSRKDYAEAERAYRDNDMNYFIQSGDMNAWCHGAAGIGLSRARAYQLLKNEEYKRHLLSAVKKTIQTDVDMDFQGRSATLCHGLGGNSDVFIDAYLTLGDQSFLNYAEIISQKTLNIKKAGLPYQPGLMFAKEEDLSLFMGNAGIGYFYLRIIDPEGTPSIEYPKLSKVFTDSIDPVQYPFIAITREESKRILLEKYFVRTIHTIKEFAPVELEKYWKEDNDLTQENESFDSFVNDLGKAIKGVNKKLIRDIYHLEKRKMDMDLTISSNAYLYTWQFMNERNNALLMEKPDEELMHLFFLSNPGNKIEQVNWDWSTFSVDTNVRTFKTQTSPNTVLLFPTFTGVVEIKMSALAAAILETLNNKKTMAEMLTETTELFDKPSDIKGEELIKESILRQARELLKMGMIYSPL